METLHCYYNEKYIGNIEVEEDLCFTHYTRLGYPFGMKDYLSINKKAFKDQESDNHIVCITNWMNSDKDKRKDITKKFNILYCNHIEKGKK